ncbi:DUF1428 domain-containing protein [Mesorhizobium sp. CAU 1741]|uniref:DUF1428 domain-containing protein n=1 Tax=Mesorhizobium sp. CAU 1741 TaxID=3140366 RepID=UPI00325A4E72
MTYVDGFVAAVPAANKEAYRKHAEEAAPLFREFGGTRLVECWGDDVPEGKVTDFRQAVKAKDGEVIVFSWIEYPSKEARNAAGEKMMSDPRMEAMGAEMPFDAKRMIYGGFAPIVEDGKSSGTGYVDGALIAVPAGNKQAYLDFSAIYSSVMKDSGASRVVDCWGDDVPDGKITDFKGAVKAEDGETVVFSWVEWPSKQARDEGWGKAMADPRMTNGKMPFDGQRMIHGGFAPIVDA